MVAPPHAEPIAVLLGLDDQFAVLHLDGRPLEQLFGAARGHADIRSGPDLDVVRPGDLDLLEASDLIVARDGRTAVFLGMHLASGKRGRGDHRCDGLTHVHTSPLLIGCCITLFGPGNDPAQEQRTSPDPLPRVVHLAPPATLTSPDPITTISALSVARIEMSPEPQTEIVA